MYMYSIRIYTKYFRYIINLQSKEWNKNTKNKHFLNMCNCSNVCTLLKPTDLRGNRRTCLYLVITTLTRSINMTTTLAHCNANLCKGFAI